MAPRAATLVVSTLTLGAALRVTPSINAKHAPDPRASALAAVCSASLLLISPDACLAGEAIDEAIVAEEAVS